MLFRSGPREPEYEGKSLSEWLEGFNGSGPDINSEVSQAIVAMGTNALPCLVAILEAEDSRFKLNLIRLSRKQSLIKFPIKAAADHRGPALGALYLLDQAGKLGQAAKTAIERHCPEGGGESCQWLQNAHRWEGPRVAVPVIKGRQHAVPLPVARSKRVPSPWGEAGPLPHSINTGDNRKIGRASCRERV